MYIDSLYGCHYLHVTVICLRFVGFGSSIPFEENTSLIENQQPPFSDSMAFSSGEMVRGRDDSPGKQIAIPPIMHLGFNDF